MILVDRHKLGAMDEGISLNTGEPQISTLGGQHVRTNCYLLLDDDYVTVGDHLRALISTRCWAFLGTKVLLCL